MSFYPSIDYVGAGKAIADQWSDLPRVDRERDETDMRRQLQNKQMTLYDLQTRKANMEMEEMQRNQEFDRTLSGRVSSRMAAGDFDPSIGQTVTPNYNQSLGGNGYEVPGEQTVPIMVPPKLNLPDYMARESLMGGRTKEAMGYMDKSRSELKDAITEITTAGKQLGPTYAKSVQKSLSMRIPALQHLDIQFKDSQPESIIQKNPQTGEPAFIQTSDGKGGWHQVVRIATEKDPTPNLARMVNDEAEQLVTAGKLSPADAPGWKVNRMSQATVEGKRKFVFQPEKTPADLTILHQINSERKAAGQPPLSTEEYMAGKKAKKEAGGLGELKTKNSGTTKTTDLSKKPWGKWAQ